MAQPFVLQCLGSPRLLTTAGEPVRFRTKKHVALFVRLALEPGRLLTRDYLVDLLWPAAPLRQARHSLVQALSVLRGKLGREHVVAQLTQVGVKADVVASDALDLAAGQAEIRGDFLDGFDIPDAPQFEAWKDEWRARLAPQIRDCLVKQMAAARRIGDYRTLEARAQLLHEFDPLSEDAIRGLIEARVEAGDRGNAIRLFQRYEERLGAELKAKPSAELVRFVSQLRTSHVGVRAVKEAVLDATAPRFSPRGATRFVGRAQEYATLYDAWEQAKGGKPAWVVVLGDPGLGKTSLMNRIAQAVVADGGLALRTQAYESERFVPYAIFGDLARQLVASPAVAGTDPVWLGELGRICPEVQDLYPGAPAAADLPAEVIPLRLAEAFVRTLAEVSTELAVMLGVDDLHLADESSVGVLHVILRKLTTQRLMSVVSIRTTELATSVQAGALLDDAASDNGRHVALSPLSDVQVEELVTGLLDDFDTPTGPQVVRRIQQKAGGNPLAAELLALDWIQRREASLLVVADEVMQPAPGSERIPAAIREALHRQLARLDPKTRGALDLAAVLGRRIGELRFYRALGLSMAEATAALDTLLESYLLRETPEGLEFRNELLRLQVYYATPAPARKHLHALVADRLLKADPTPAGQLAAETAWHLWRADRTAEAVPLAIEGARNALDAGAPIEAQKTLEAVRRLRISPDQTRTTSLLLAQAYLSQGRPHEALKLVQDATRNGSEDSSVLAETDRIIATAMYVGRLGSTKDFAAAADSALASAKAVGNPWQIARALQLVAFAADQRHDMTAIRGALQEAISLTDRCADEPAGLSWVVRAFCEAWMDDMPAACRSLTTAVTLLRSGRNAVDLSFAMNGMGICAMSSCDTEAAEAAFQDSLKLAREVGDDTRVSRVISNIACLRLWQGRFEESVRLSEEALAASNRSEFDRYKNSTFANLASALWPLGRFEEAKTALQKGEDWALRQPHPAPRAMLHAEWADYFLAAGSFEQAMGRINQLRELYPMVEWSNLGGRGTILRLLAFGAFYTEGAGRARMIADEAIERFRKGHAIAYVHAIATQAWLYRQGAYNHGPEVEPTLEFFERLGVRGLCQSLALTGFLPSSRRPPKPELLSHTFKK